MTTSNSTLTLTDVGQLIAAIPAMLGFLPQDSLVVVSHRDRALGVVLRTDLPPLPIGDEFADQLLRPMHGQDCTGVSIVVIGGCSASEHRPLIEEVRERFDGIDVPVLQAVHVREVREGVGWRCIEHDDCHGLVADPRASPIATLTTFSGAVVYPSRDALEQQIKRAPQKVLDRRAAMLAELSTATEPGATADTVAALRAIDSAAKALYENRSEFTDEQVVELAVALGCPSIRDAMLVANDLGPQRPLRRLWTFLSSELPDPECAEAACLLGVDAYLEGDGALAGIALNRAIESSPDHELAKLLIGALYSGTSPGSLRGLLEKATERAKTDIDRARDAKSA